MPIIRARSQEDIAACKALFIEYAESMDFDLCFQDFEGELADFPGKYALPTGELLLARQKEHAVGVVGMRDLGDKICEMKRLYVRDIARGSGLGEELAKAIIDRAHLLGYRAMRLDTIPGHHDMAIRLYRSLGFQEIPPYCYNPIPGAVYMELKLPASFSTK